jgi:inhibitor of cysteine peptidase
MSGKVIDSLPAVMFILLLVGLLVAFGASLMAPSASVAASLGANGTTITVNGGASVKISLDENPTTGYSWNETFTSGLTVVDSKYIPGRSNIMGAGGVHEWVIKATGKGQQRFSAVYKRPWEPIAGNETTFTLNISVT